MLRVIRSYLLYTWGGLHRLFGNQNNLRREHERAVYYFDRAYAVNPSFLQARLARAVILWRELGELEEAIANFSELLERDPAYGPALFNRAMARQELGHYEAALHDLEVYLALEKSNKYREQAKRMHGWLEALTQELADES